MRRTAMLAIFALASLNTGCTVATIDGAQGTEAGLLGVDIELGEVHRPDATSESLGDGLQLIDGEVVLDGDMILGPIDDVFEKLELGTRSPSSTGIVNRQFDFHFLWPKGIVRYQIVAGFSKSKRQQINSALNHWRDKTPLKFVAASSGKRVFFRPSNKSCSATVGYQPNNNNMRVLVSPSCGTGSLIHEIGHVVGLLHEHVRCNRDTFVKINWNNIAEKHRHNFYRRCADGETYTSYDYGSIMHYSNRAFSKNGWRTIVKKRKGPAIGQRKGLSKKDIEGVRRRYAEVLGGGNSGGGGSDCEQACDYLYGSCGIALVTHKQLSKAECAQFCSGLKRNNMTSCVRSASCNIGSTLSCFN